MGPVEWSSGCEGPTVQNAGRGGLDRDEATPAHTRADRRKLREGERLLHEGKDLAEVLRHLEISEATWNRWRNLYGGMKADGAKRLRELETENAG